MALYFSFSETYTKFLFIIALLGVAEFLLENYLGMEGALCSPSRLFQFKLFIVLNKAFETFDEKVMSRESETKGFKRQEPQLTKNDRFRNTEQQRLNNEALFFF